MRPPHGRAPALTRLTATVRLLRSTLLVTVLALALAAAGCGSNEAQVPEVPGPPAELTVPHQKGAADLSQSSASATPTPSASATATPTAASGATGSTGTTGGTGTNTAATPAPASQDTQANDTKPAAGSAPQQFEQFCQENAGAC